MRVVERGQVTEIVNKYKVKVRVLEIHKPENAPGATSNEELVAGITAIQPGIYPEYRVGDTVILGFESRGYSKPVVLGLLDSSSSRKTKSIASHSDLTATGVVKLSESTSIGEVTKTNIKTLTGLTKNIKTKFSELDVEDSRLDGLIEAEATTRKEKDDALETKQGSMSVQIQETADSLTGHTGDAEIHVSEEDRTAWTGCYKYNVNIKVGNAIPTDTKGYNEGDIFILLKK